MFNSHFFLNSHLNLCYQTYSLIDVFTSVHSDNLSGGLNFMSYSRMVNEFSFHNWLKCNIWWMFYSSWETACRWFITCFSISFAIYIFTCNTRDVATVSRNLFPGASWLLNIFSGILLFRLVSCITWNRVLVIGDEHIFGGHYILYLISFILKIIELYI